MTSNGHPAGAGLYLLFEQGDRPDLDGVQSALSGDSGIAITHRGTDPPAAREGSASGGHPADGALHVAELLCDGLTFDLAGMKPGPRLGSVDLPVAIDPPEARASLSYTPLRLTAGPHLSGAQGSLPVLRAQMRIAVALCSGEVGPRAIGWSPSGAFMGADAFARIAGNWLGGGAFPALGLVTYSAAVDGGLESTGLSYITGQELRIEPDAFEDRAAASRLAMRLVDRLAGSAAVTQGQDLTGPEGEALRLEPSRNGRFVRVCRRPGHF